MVEVRAALPDDAMDVAGVHVRSWQAAYRGIFDDEFLDSLRPEDRVTRYSFGSDDPSSPTTIVAEDDGTILGFATTGACRDEDALGLGELYALYVDASAFGLGGGRLLLAEARGRLLGAGFTEAVLWVLADNVRAQLVYERDGWWRDGAARHEDIWAVPADVVRYRRTLAV